MLVANVLVQVNFEAERLGAISTNVIGRFGVLDDHVSFRVVLVVEDFIAESALSAPFRKDVQEAHNVI